MLNPQPLLFGESDSPLLGIYHPAQQPATHRQESAAVRAVVLCPPLGAEYMRTHRALRGLALQLAAQGIHVLRLDYRGTGDSAGWSHEVDSLRYWVHDIRLATDQLHQLCGCDSSMLLGLRFGASLASLVAAQEPRVNSLLLWEPIIDGGDYLARLRNLHQQLLDQWIYPLQVQANPNGEELLGTRYHHRLLEELQAFHLDLADLPQPRLVVQLSGEQLPGEAVGDTSLLKHWQVDDPNSWYQLSELEGLWLRPQTSCRIADQVGDMFDRLERLGCLPLESAAIESRPTPPLEPLSGEAAGSQTGWPAARDDRSWPSSYSLELGIPGMGVGG
jgi:pimeloyl-ACP methyl ester carboxylesterase